MSHIKTFDSDLLKINITSYKNNGIYYIGYNTIKDIVEHESIHSVNPLYFIIDEVDGYIEEKNGKWK